jgi:hypothetical protein
MQQVSSAQFNYRDFPPDDRLPAFRHMTAALYDTWALGAASDFRAEAIGHQVGDLVFNEVAFSPARFQRRAAHTSGRDRDFLTLQAQLAGEELLTMDCFRATSTCATGRIPSIPRPRKCTCTPSSYHGIDWRPVPR